MIANLVRAYFRLSFSKKALDVSLQDEAPCDAGAETNMEVA
jgi:hypothetical protein